MGASREDDALARRMGKISEKSVNVVVVERPEAREALARTCLRAMLRERGAFDRVATFEDGTCARVERDDARDAFCLRETLLDGVEVGASPRRHRRDRGRRVRHWTASLEPL